MNFSKWTQIPITLPPDLTQDQLFTHRPFQEWLTTLEKSLDLQHRQSKHPFHADPYVLRGITVQSCDYFGEGSRLGFVKLKADITNEAGERLPGAVFLRGGSVVMLLVLSTDDGVGMDGKVTGKVGTDHEVSRDGKTAIDGKATAAEEYVVLTVQPRIAAGSLGFVELPAGMIDDEGSFGGAAAREIKEETGLEIAEDELVDLTALALRRTTRHDDQRGSGGGQSRGEDGGKEEEETSDSEKEKLQVGIYPSPGGSDEFMPVFLARKTMTPDEIEDLKGKLTGLRDHGEKITLRICRLRDLWRAGARDGKTLAAVALYEGLKREGVI